MVVLSAIAALAAAFDCSAKLGAWFYSVIRWQVTPSMIDYICKECRTM